MHNALMQNFLTLMFSSLFHSYELWNKKDSLCRLGKEFAYHTVPVSLIVGASAGAVQLWAKQVLNDVDVLLRSEPLEEYDG
jgi:hypothetical protein